MLAGLSYTRRVDLDVGYAKSGDLHIAYHVMGEGPLELAGAGEVLVSGTVKDLVAGSGIAFEVCGTVRPVVRERLRFATWREDDESHRRAAGPVDAPLR
jgi:hypothetical protein